MVNVFHAHKFLKEVSLVAESLTTTLEKFSLSEVTDSSASIFADRLFVSLRASVRTPHSQGTF